MHFNTTTKHALWHTSTAYHKHTPQVEHITPSLWKLVRVQYCTKVIQSRSGTENQHSPNNGNLYLKQ